MVIALAGAAFLLPLNKLDTFGDANESNDDNQDDHHRHTLFEW
jgi:hypothetical protein